MLHRALVSVFAVASFLGLDIAPLAYAEDDGWTCGAWASDPSGKCEEVRTCTRRKCRDIQDLTSCTSETRKECANPKPPPKPTRYNQVAPAVGGLPQTTDPGHGPGDSVSGPLNGTYDAPPVVGAPPATGNVPTNVLECRQERVRLIVVNTTAQTLERGRVIAWRLISGLKGQTLLPMTLAAGEGGLLTELPASEWQAGKRRCEARVVRARAPISP